MSDLLDNLVPAEQRNSRFKEQRAIENNVSQARSAAELGDPTELERAIRLTRRAVSAAKNAGLSINVAVIDATLLEIQLKGYRNSVTRLVDRVQKKAAKGDLADVEASMQLIHGCVAKAKEHGETISIDEEVIGQALVRAEELAKQNAKRDAVIAAHMKQMGDAFVSLFDAVSPGAGTGTGDKSGK